MGVQDTLAQVVDLFYGAQYGHYIALVLLDVICLSSFCHSHICHKLRFVYLLVDGVNLFVLRRVYLLAMDICCIYLCTASR